MKKISKPKYFILDVDGVFTDGSYFYTENGKYMKRFGPEDHDALTLLDGKLQVQCVTGDKRGFAITKKRIQEDMNLKLALVSTFERIAWIKKHFNPKETIYMGDGIFDPLVFQEVLYAIAPANVFYKSKKYADYVTKNKGGEGAVAEACIHILDKFFNENFDVFSINLEKGFGVWKK